MRTIETVEENGYFMTFATDGNDCSIGEGYDREQSIKEANELADLRLTMTPA